MQPPPRTAFLVLLLLCLLVDQSPLLVIRLAGYLQVNPMQVSTLSRRYGQLAGWTSFNLHGSQHGHSPLNICRLLFHLLWELSSVALTALRVLLLLVMNMTPVV